MYPYIGFTFLQFLRLQSQGMRQKNENLNLSAMV